MTKIFVALLSFCCLLNNAAAQEASKEIDRLKIFLDCVNADCDFTFFRTEITLVDFSRDNKAADVFILVTEQNTGSGGEHYQLIFFGQNSFSRMRDTLSFNTDRNATDFEIRDQVIQYLKLGLAPFIAKTAAAKNARMDFKFLQPAGDSGQNKKAILTKDPWNYWVFRVGVNGNVRGDAVYKSSNLNSSFSANRVTDEYKIGFEGRVGRNKTGYDLVDSSGIKKNITVNNHTSRVEHFFIKSITQHWSAAYSAEFRTNTFENIKQGTELKAAVEYNIFPYKEVNTKFFAVRYFVDVRRNKYFDSTLYDKLNETLIGHGAETQFQLNQKWGNTSVGVEYHKYFKRGNFFNLGANAQVDVRITGGLSFFVFAFGEIVRDQLSLLKEDATGEEVLTRRRQLASGYNYSLNFGVNYRFGSKLNNFVNPRFN